VKFAGDEEGIVALKALHKENDGFVKALLEDARSTTDHATSFRDGEGNRYRLVIDTHSGELIITKAQRLSTFPPPAGD
jgi:hypothetical protein